MKLWVHLFREAVDRWSGSTFFDVLKTTVIRLAPVIGTDPSRCVPEKIFSMFPNIPMVRTAQV